MSGRYRQTLRIVTACGLVGLLGALLSACGGGGDQGAAAGGGGGDVRRTVAVIPKGTTHVFWKSVEAGALQAGSELGIEVVWKGPIKENDRAQQIQVVQQFLTQGVSGIVLAPLDSRALVAPVREAQSRGIPVVIFDSALEGEPGRDLVSYVATDNLAGGRMGGEHLAGLLGGQGDVVLMRYLVGSASTSQREEGFLESLAGHPGVRVTVDNRYAGATAGEAKTQALNMIDPIRRAQGIFAPNESSTYGVLLALRQEGLAGRIRFVGFDASPPLVQALRDGEIDALVVQDPWNIGYRAVGVLVAHLDGESTPPVIDTGAVLVTRQNVDDPALRRLLP
jgi:ribose transport system substrate-binding protein